MVPATSVVYGQAFPSKVIRIITAAAGGGSDFNARQVAQGISGPLGQQVIVDNRTPLQASETVSKAAPDGYTLMVGGDSMWVLSLLRQTPYDPVSDFTPISLISMDANVVAVHPSIPVKSIKDLIALAKAKPGELNYSSTPTGGSPHLAAELFKSMAGVNIVRVGYSGGAAAITALISGEVQMTIASAGSATPHAKSGKLNALAVTTAQPTALVPGLPTVAASGLPGYEFVGVTGIWAPAKTPASIIDTLNREIVRALNRPDVKERFLNSGLEIVASSPVQFAAAIKADMAKMGKVIKDAGIKLE